MKAHDRKQLLEEEARAAMEVYPIAQKDTGAKLLGFLRGWIQHLATSMKSKGEPLQPSDIQHFLNTALRMKGGAR